MLNKDEVQRRLLLVREKVLNVSAQNAKEQEVHLLAVSKTHPVQMIEWAYEKGQIDFGENYVQEANAKQKALSTLPIRWHFIGHLQKNKVKDVVGAFYLIHSVDSVELAEKISKRAVEMKVQQKILLEINLGDENTKSGFTKDACFQAFPQIIALPNLELMGLMALPPLHEDPELTRPYFRELHQLFVAMRGSLPRERRSSWTRLSMGTTHDYNVAIEEGANIVRVGTAIFGEREQKHA